MFALVHTPLFLRSTRSARLCGGGNGELGPRSLSRALSTLRQRDLPEADIGDAKLERSLTCYCLEDRCNTNAMCEITPFSRVLGRAHHSRARADASVVRRLGDNALVERSVAERGVRHADDVLVR